MTTATATKTAETPLGREATNQVWNTLRAYGPLGSDGAYQSTATRQDTDRLRLRLREYDAHSEMRPLVLLLRRFFNTYRQNGWRITGAMVAAALRLLSTVAEATAAESTVWELESERVAALGLPDDGEELARAEWLATRPHDGWKRESVDGPFWMRDLTHPGR